MGVLNLPFERNYVPAPVTNAAGTVIRKRDVPGFSLSENLYPKGLLLSRHRHTDAYLSFILAGTYTEKYLGRQCFCDEGSLRFLPPGEMHENEYVSSARCLLVKLEQLALARLGEHAPVLSAPGEVQGIAPAWLATRLYREFLAEDDVAPLAIEGILLEILAESARAIGDTGASNAPRWLRKVREALDDSYLQSPSLADLSAIAGVHPVHLSREFRKHYHSTIGEFIRKRRIEKASNLLSNSDMPLSEIALTCGFSDQSHFSAMFKSHSGLTPAKFREMSRQ